MGGLLWLNTLARPTGACDDQWFAKPRGERAVTIKQPFQRIDTMPTLRIDLQDGFFEDHVTIELDGKRIYDQQPVSTSMKTGLAGAVETETFRESATLVVKVGERTYQQTVKLYRTKDTHAGVSITRDGGLSVQTSKEPYGYA